MNKVRIKEDIIMVIVISFFGYCFENLWMLVRYSIVNNRNMFLPFLFGYGIFIVALYYLIGTPKKIFNKFELKAPLNYLAYMGLSFALVSIGEILLGTFAEKVCNFGYWDYSKIPLHFTKYTSVPTSLGFASVITLFMNFAYEPLKNKTKNIAKKIPLFILVLAFVILVADLCVSFKIMGENNGNNTIWNFNLKE